jgi:hypothetical protein
MTVHTLKDLKANLKRNLESDCLTPGQMSDSVRDCFVICQRDFFAARKPERSQVEIDQISRELVNEVFKEQAIDPNRATPLMLRHVINILDARFDFAQDPAIMAVHESVIDVLLAKPINDRET